MRDTGIKVIASMMILGVTAGIMGILILAIMKG